MVLNWAQFARREHFSDNKRTALFHEIKRLLRRGGIELHTADTLPLGVWRELVKRAYAWREIEAGTFEMWD